MASGDRVLVEGLDLVINEGTFTGVLGRNGVGKTTTLHVLAGLLPAARGSVLLDGQTIDTWSRKAMAQQIGLLMQSYEDPFPSTVMETALAGRHPHIGFWQWESEDDLRIAAEALSEMGLEALEHRRVRTLSGGERRRLALAAVLAQDPQVYLLDEPANHLDPQHVRDVLTLFRTRADSGRSVMASMHDVNASARYCDRCLLLYGDGRWAEGPSDEILTESNLSDLFGIPIRSLEWNQRRVFLTE